MSTRRSARNANSPNLNDPAVLVAVLSSLSANDTNVIKQAEKALKPFMKTLQCVPALISLLTTSQDVSVRHHSALLLKKKMHFLYGKCSAPQREQLKTSLLQLVVNEPVKAVRTAVAGVIASMAKGVFELEKDWAALFQLLLQLAQNPNESLRSLNYTILEQLCEHIGAHLKKHTATLAQMFVMGCGDSVTTVAVDALKAAANYFTFLASLPAEEAGDIMLLESVVTPMLLVMQGCLTRGDEEVTAEGLVVFQEICQIEQPLINPHLEAVIPFIMSILQNDTYDMPVKIAAGDTLTALLQSRPKLIAKKNMVEPIMRALVQMIAKGDNDKAMFNFNERTNAVARAGDEDEDDDDEDYDPEVEFQQLSQMCIDAMSLHIPSKHFAPPALNVCAQCMDSADPKFRKAGCVVMGVIAEGCSDMIKTILGQIIPKLVAATKDPEYYVRETACFALGQFSEHCQPDILFHHATVLPAIFAALADDKPSVQSSSCYVIEMFCENLQPETLKPLLPTMVTKLMHLIQVAQPSNKEMALSALAASAVAAEINFLPFAEPCCRIIANLLFSTEPTLHSLRGRALECWGHVCIAVGKENFTPYFATGLQSATQGIELDEVLKEHAYIYFANTAKIMGNAYDSSLSQLVPHLHEVIVESELVCHGEDDDEDEEEDEGAAAGSSSSGSTDEDEEYEDDDDDDEGGRYGLNVHSGFINTKKAAITALGYLAAYTKAAFGPHLVPSLEVLMASYGALESNHEMIRAEAMVCLEQLTHVCVAIHGPAEAPPAGTMIQLHPSVLEIVKNCLTYFINAMGGETSKEAAAKACDGVSEVLQRLGVAVLAIMTDEKDKSVPLMQPLMKALTLIVTEKSVSQTAAKYEQDDEDDDDHDDVLMESATDLIGTLAKTMGAGFLPSFDTLLKPLLKFTKPARSYSDRAMVIGCFSEVVGAAGTDALKYAELLLPVLRTGLADAMEPVRRNSAYCVGVLFEATKPALSSQVLPMLQCLHPLCTRPAHQQGADVGGADIDNAIAAVARIIQAFPSVVPLPQVLPVILQSLPLRADLGEATCVYGMLQQLVMADEPTVTAALPHLLTIYAGVLAEGSKFEDETKAMVQSGLKAMVAVPAKQQLLLSAVGQIQDNGVKAILQTAVSK